MSSCCATKAKNASVIAAIVIHSSIAIISEASISMKENELKGKS